MFGFRFEVGGVGYGGASGWESGMDEADGSPCLVEYDKPGPAAERRSLRRGHPRQHPPAAGQRLAHAAFSGATVDSGHGAGKKVGEPLVAIRHKSAEQYTYFIIPGRFYSVGRAAYVTAKQSPRATAGKPIPILFNHATGAMLPSGSPDMQKGTAPEPIPCCLGG